MTCVFSFFFISFLGSSVVFSGSILSQLVPSPVVMTPSASTTLYHCDCRGELTLLTTLKAMIGLVPTNPVKVQSRPDNFASDKSDSLFLFFANLCTNSFIKYAPLIYLHFMYVFVSCVFVYCLALSNIITEITNMANIIILHPFYVYIYIYFFLFFSSFFLKAQIYKSNYITFTAVLRTCVAIQ